MTQASLERPLCPQCGERDRVRLPGEPGGPGHVLPKTQPTDPCNAWCDRCLGFLLNLQPRPGRHVPDFEGAPLETRKIPTPEQIRNVGGSLVRPATETPCWAMWSEFEVETAGGRVLVIYDPLRRKPRSKERGVFHLWGPEHAWYAEYRLNEIEEADHILFVGREVACREAVARR